MKKVGKSSGNLYTNENCTYNRENKEQRRLTELVESRLSLKQIKETIPGNAERRNT